MKCSHCHASTEHINIPVCLFFHVCFRFDSRIPGLGSHSVNTVWVKFLSWGCFRVTCPAGKRWKDQPVAWKCVNKSRKQVCIETCIAHFIFSAKVHDDRHDVWIIAGLCWTGLHVLPGATVGFITPVTGCKTPWTWWLVLMVLMNYI